MVEGILQKLHAELTGSRQEETRQQDVAAPYYPQFSRPQLFRTTVAPVTLTF